MMKTMASPGVAPSVRENRVIQKCRGNRKNNSDPRVCKWIFTTVLSVDRSTFDKPLMQQPTCLVMPAQHTL